MMRLAQALAAAALLSTILLAGWHDQRAIAWPHLLPPALVALAQLALTARRTWCRVWLSRGLAGLALAIVVMLLASFLIPQSWIAFATWNEAFRALPAGLDLTQYRPALLWLISVALLAINVLLRLRLGLGSPALLFMAAMLLGIQGMAAWHPAFAATSQSYVASLPQQLTLWLLCLGQLGLLLGPLRQQVARVIVPLSVSAGVALIATLWWQQLQVQEDHRLYLASDRQGARLAARLNQEIGDQLGAMRRFVSFWELFDQVPSKARWQRQVATYQHDYRYFQDIGFITPEGVIRWVYPSATNRGVVGTRLFETQPAGQAALRQALVERKEGQAGVVELLQGGKGMIYYLPIVAASSDSLLGAASMVISLETLVNVMLEQIDVSHIAITLADDDQLLVRTGPFTHLATWSHRHAVDTGVDRLTLLTRPSRAFLLQNRARLPELTLVSGLMLAYLLYQLLYAQRRLGLQNRATQRANAELLAEVETRTRLQQEVEWMARHDELTALPNRRQFMEYVTRCQSRLPLTVMICDIDHFKRVNDRLGHLVGDRYLKAFGERAQPVIDTRGGLFARYGGEEFVVCLPDCASARAEAIANALRQALAETQLTHHDGQPVTISIGLATLAEGELDIASLMQRADEALYRAKEAGRNRVVAVL